MPSQSHRSDPQRRQRPADSDKPPARGETLPKSHENPAIPDKSRLDGKVCRFEQVRGTGERELIRLADLQHGCIHRVQLLDAGIGRGAITHRLATGRLHQVHPKVFLVGRPVSTRFTAAMAAVLSFRGDAALCGESAAEVWGIPELAADEVSVLLVGRNARPLRGVRIQRVARLDRADTRWRHGLPVTSPARTLIDLAGMLGPSELEAALASVYRPGLARRSQILEAIERTARSTKGIGVLRQLLHDERQAPADTRSRYERKLLALIAAAELPAPVTNVPVEGQLVDFYWPQQRLVVEFDGFAYHGDRLSFERDRRRDQRLIAAGLRVMRVTARHVDHTPYATIARFSAALAAAA